MKTSQGLLLRLLGAHDEPDSQTQFQPPPQAAMTQLADRELLERISEFLIGNGLAVTSDKLAIAHAAFSGEAVGLSRTIAGKTAAGERITQAWLQSIMPTDS